MRKILQYPTVMLFLMYCLAQVSAQSEIKGDDFDRTHYLTSEGKSFSVVQTSMEDFYKNRDKGKGSGYKQWKRWENWMNDRQNTDGTVSNPTRHDQLAIKQSKKNNEGHFNPKNNQKSTTGLWEAIGPTEYSTRNNTVTGTGLGRLNCIAFHPTDPNTIYVGAPTGGLWRTIDGGQTWEPKLQDIGQIGVSGIVERDGVIYALTGDGDLLNTACIGVFQSSDNGDTWTPMPLPWHADSTVYGYKIMLDPLNRLLLATTDGLYLEDGIVLDWLKVYDGDITDVEIDNNNNSSIIIAGVNPPPAPGRLTQAYVSQTLDYYHTFSPKDTLSGISRRIALAVSPSDQKFGYILEGRSPRTWPVGQFAGFTRWNNGNINDQTSLTNTPNIMGWRRDGQDTGDQHIQDIAMVVNPYDTDHIITGGISLWESKDGGNSWNNLAFWHSDFGNVPDSSIVHADIHALEYNPLDDKLYCANDGGLYVSADFGESWVDISKGLAISQIYRIDGTGGEVFSMGLHDNGTYIMGVDGDGYSIGGGDGTDTKINPSDPDSIYYSSQNGSIRFTPDRGNTSMSIRPAGATNALFVAPIETRSDDFRFILAGYGDRVYWSDECGKGNSWSFFDANTNDGFRYIKVNFDNTRVFASMNNRIYTSLLDNLSSTSWEDITGDLDDALSLSGVNITGIEASLTKVYVSLSGTSDGNKVFVKNIASGTTWTNISHDLPNAGAMCVMINNGVELYLGTTIGVYRHLLGSQSWTLFKQGMPRVTVNDLDKNTSKNVIYAATFGRGLWRSGAYSTCSDYEYLTGRRPSFGGNDITGSNPGNQYIKAGSTIESSRIINASASNLVIYQAEDLQILKPGFHAKKNSFFKAIIDKDCSYDDPEAN